MSSKRRRDPVRQSTLIKVMAVAVIVLLILVIGVKILQKKVTSKFGSAEETTVESAEVTSGSISTSVTGDGTLANEEGEDLTIPSTVEIKKIYVEAGDKVSQGDLMASVNTTSVVTAMSEIQNEMDELDEELSDVADETISSTIKATVSGRIKKIYGSTGDDVATVMYDNTALMLESLDGLMACDVTTDALAAEDKVTVVTSNNKSYTGTVEKVIDGTATITLTDNGPAYGDTVTVKSGDTTIGTGTLYIHKELKVTGYAGTIKSISVKANAEVSSGDTLMTLSDTSYTANYETLLKEREDLQDQLQNLLVIYKEGAVYAQEDGIIASVSEGSASSASSSTAGNSSAMSVFGQTSTGSSQTGSSSSEGDTVITIAPADTMTLTLSIDESDILSLEEGQTATVTIDSLDDETFSGTVASINTDGSSSNGVTTYSVEVTVERSDEMLAGMSASAVISIEGKDNALLLPVDAVKKTSSTAYVYTSYDEETDTLSGMTEVTIGISNSQYIEITDGLSEGDTVYYKPSSENNGFDFSDFGGGNSFPSMGGGNGGSSQGGGMSMPSQGGGKSGGFSGMPGQ